MTANVWISDNKTMFEATKTNVTFECKKNENGSFYIRIDGYQAESFTMTAEQFAAFKDWIAKDKNKFKVGDKVLINKNSPAFFGNDAKSYQENFGVIGELIEADEESIYPYRASFNGLKMYFAKEELIHA